jgi:lipoprotein-anchoring transpeptidase ErfK/SrfK
MRLSLTAVVCLMATAAACARAVPAPAAVAADQRLALLLSPHAAHRAPRAGSPLLTSIAPRRPITGEATALPVLAAATSPSGVRWLRVRLPGRPNGASGWIAQQGTHTLLTGWRLTVSLAARTVTVFRHGARVRSFHAVVGKPSTPTPPGNFFVEETLRMSPGEPGGPFALALSARSDALQEFEGGPGQIALHGRDLLGGTLGAAESHGCVRLGTAAISWLARRIGPGVPVSIRAH